MSDEVPEHPASREWLRRMVAGLGRQLDAIDPDRRRLLLDEIEEDDPPAGDDDAATPHRDTTETE